MKRKGISPLALVLGVLVIVVLGVYIINKIDADNAQRRAQLDDVNGQLNDVEQKEGSVTAELNKLDEGKYIVTKAREYDYVLPGEIVFIVEDELLED